MAYWEDMRLSSMEGEITDMGFGGDEGTGEGARSEIGDIEERDNWKMTADLGKDLYWK
jgi:hypothetical protein